MAKTTPREPSVTSTWTVTLRIGRDRTPAPTSIVHTGPGGNAAVDSRGILTISEGRFLKAAFAAGAWTSLDRQDTPAADG